MAYDSYDKVRQLALAELKAWYTWPARSREQLEKRAHDVAHNVACSITTSDTCAIAAAMPWLADWPAEQASRSAVALISANLVHELALDLVITINSGRK